jgi:hypothetical protein
MRRLPLNGIARMLRVVMAQCAMRRARRRPISVMVVIVVVSEMHGAPQ